MRRPALSAVVTACLALLLAGVIVAVAPARPSENATSVASSTFPHVTPTVIDDTPTATPTEAGTPAEAPTPTPTPTHSPAPAPLPTRTDDARGRGETFVSPAPRTETFAVLDVGTVTLAIGDVLQVVDVQPSRPDWRVEMHALGREAEVSFRAGAQRVDWKAEFEDGQVRIRVRDRRAEDRSDGAASPSPSTTDDHRGRGSHDD